MLGRAGKAVQQSEVNKQATKQLGKLAENVKHRVDEAVHNMHSPTNNAPGKEQSSNVISGADEFEEVLNEAEKAATGTATTTAEEERPSSSSSSTTAPPAEPLVKSETDGDASRPSLYVSEASAGDEEEPKSASVQRV